MKNTLLLCGILLIFLQGKAQQPSIRFYLVNEETGIAVAGASIMGTDTRFATVSHETGMVVLNKFSGQSITVSAIGYASETIRVADIQAEQKIRLTPAITSLSEINVSASARTGVFHTISDLDIHIRPIANSQEVLRMVPGLFIGQHAGGGKAEQIFLRGFDIDHGTGIQLTVDGMPVNMVSHAHGQGYADMHFVIPELIEKADFNKGPYFAEKGNFATAGHVAFRTKDYIEKDFIKLEGGQFNTFRAVTGINLLNEKTRTEKNQSLFIGGEASYTKGFFDSPQDFTRFNGLIKYHGQVSPRSSFSSSLSGFSSKWDASGQIPDRAVKDGSIGWFGAIDDTEGGNTGRYNFNNVLTTYFDNGWRWKNQLYYSKYVFELYSNFTFFLENPADGDQIRQKENRNILGFHSEADQKHRLGNKESRFKTGIQLRYDATGNTELSSTRNRETVLNPIMNGDIRELNAAVFAEENIRLNQRLDLTIGLRGDHFSNQYTDHLAGQELSSSSFIASPKLNLQYRIHPGLQLYWYNGQGFHSNDTRVAVQQNGRDVVTPAWGSDLGAVVKIGERALLQTAFWYLWLEQEFVYVGDAGIVEPGGRTRRMGWDASLRYEIIPSLYADMDLNYARPRALDVPKPEAYIPLAPTFTSTGGFTYRKSDGWNGSLRYRYMGDRPANEFNDLTAEGYFIVDAAINYTRPKWEAGVFIQNLLNSKWKETQFDTESRLRNESVPVSEIHFTPGTPFFARAAVTLFF